MNFVSRHGSRERWRRQHRPKIPVLLLASLVVLAASFDVRVARAEDPTGIEPEETTAATAAPAEMDPAARPDPDAPPDPAEVAESEPGAAAPAKSTGTDPRVEEIVIQAGESQAASDFASGDSVAAFDASDLEALGAQSIGDLAAYTPNLEIVTSGATTPTFFIRGVGLNDFNSNSSGAVSIYQDDVQKNSPALQLGTLFDVEAVNILRGPQGTGPYRNASAGAIKLYSRRPSGNYGGYLLSNFGNNDYLDFEGAVEAPIYEDILSGRFAFRYSQRDGYARNRCADAPRGDLTGGTNGERNTYFQGNVLGGPDLKPVKDFTGRNILVAGGVSGTNVKTVTVSRCVGGLDGPSGKVCSDDSDCRNNGANDPGICTTESYDGPSQCGENVEPGQVAKELVCLGGTNPGDSCRNNSDCGGPGVCVPDGDIIEPRRFVGGKGFSKIANDLPKRINDLGNWAARGTLLFQPTLDMEWILTVQGARRDEDSRLGQSYGTKDLADKVFDQSCSPFLDGTTAEWPDECKVRGILGGHDGAGYQPEEVKQARREANPCVDNTTGESLGTCDTLEFASALNDAKHIVAKQLAQDPLDSAPHKGDFNRVGPTTNDVWSVALNGDIALGSSLFLTTVSGYDSYDRLIDVDLDQSPSPLFEILTDDDGWQFMQGLNLAGHVSEDLQLTWNVGGFYLMEELNVTTANTFLDAAQQTLGVGGRDYTQKLWSVGGYGDFSWDIGSGFTLDGGFRYNWDKKELDLVVTRAGNDFPIDLSDTWDSPTGTIRLTYRFREDTHAYWKYTRGWKGGHYNATTSGLTDDIIADPETIDAFETGVRGSWFEGRLGLDFSLFHYNYQDYQIFTARQNLGEFPEFVIINANNAEVYGAEVDLVARPLPGTYLQARFGWLKTQFLDFVQRSSIRQQLGSGTEIINIDIQNSGNQLLNSPEYKVSLTAEQTLPLGRFGALTFRYDGAWTDDTNYDATEGQGLPNRQGDQFLPPHTIGQAEFWLHNLRVSYRVPSGGVELAAWVRNLEDTAYKTFAFDGSTFNDTTIYFVGEPRTFGLSVTTTF